MKWWKIAFLPIVLLVMLAGCSSQSTTSTAAAKTVVQANCGVSVTAYGGSASASSYTLVGNSYCTAVISHDDTDSFGKPFVVSGSSKSAKYAILYMDRPDANWHYNTRLVFVGPAEGKASSLAALTPGGNWTAEFVYAFVPDNSATPALTADLASTIVRRVEPVDSVYAFSDAALPGAQACTTLSDALALH